MQCILFDLDGTLTDPQEGITRCIQYALEKAGLAVPNQKDLLWCIGPPLHESFANLAPGHGDPMELVGFYRERFSTVGLYENAVYPGIAELLEEVSRKKKVFLATSKPQVFARQILAHFKVSQYFHGAYGSELDGTRSDKGDLIKYIVAKENLPIEHTAIVGDRKHDVIGAKKAGIRSLGVTWGYGSREELETAGADHLFASVPDLKKFLI